MAVNETRARQMANSVSWHVIAIVSTILFIPPFWATGFGLALYQSLFVPLAIGLMLLFSMEKPSRLRRFLCLRPVQAIGATSYGIYLWQQLFTGPKVTIIETGPVANFAGAGQVIPMCLPLLAVIVPLSYFFIEKPAMRLGKRLSLRAKQREFVGVPDWEHNPTDCR